MLLESSISSSQCQVTKEHFSNSSTRIKYVQGRKHESRWCLHSCKGKPGCACGTGESTGLSWPVRSTGMLPNLRDTLVTLGSFWSFIYSHKYILSTFFVGDTKLYVGIVVMNKTNIVFALMEFSVQLECGQSNIHNNHNSVLHVMISLTMCQVLCYTCCISYLF